MGNIGKTREMHRNIGKLLYILGTCYGVLHEILTKLRAVIRAILWRHLFPSEISQTLHGFWISALFAKKSPKTQHSKRKGKYCTPWFNSLEDQDSSQFWNGGRRQRTNEWCVKNWGSFWNMMNLPRPHASSSALVPKIGSSVGSVVNFKMCLFTLWSFDWELHGPLTFPFIVYGRRQNKDYFISQRMSIYMLNYNTLYAQPEFQPGPRVAYSLKGRLNQRA